MQEKIVDFIGIGTPKAATTWIYECLNEHPEICMSADKEVNFFSDPNYERGQEWYTKQFAHCSANVLRGEFSPNYIYSTEAAQRIKEVAPDAKLIVVLRNPVERFISQFYFEYGMARHDISDIENIPGGMQKRLLRKSMYYHHLKAYLNFFPREYIHFCLYEDIEKSPLSFMQDIYRFLGVDGSIVPYSIDRRANITNKARTRFRGLKRWYYHLYRSVTKSRFRSVLVPILCTLRIPQLATSLVSKTERKSDTLPDEQKEVPQTFRAELHAAFANDITQLEKLIDRDLSFWE